MVQPRNILFLRMAMQYNLLLSQCYYLCIDFLITIMLFSLFFSYKFVSFSPKLPLSVCTLAKTITYHALGVCGEEGSPAFRWGASTACRRCYSLDVLTPLPALGPPGEIFNYIIEILDGRIKASSGVSSSDQLFSSLLLSSFLAPRPGAVGWPFFPQVVMQVPFRWPGSGPGNAKNIPTN